MHTLSAKLEIGFIGCSGRMDCHLSMISFNLLWFLDGEERKVEREKKVRVCFVRTSVSR
jgi:hypothetical protein